MSDIQLVLLGAVLSAIMVAPVAAAVALWIHKKQDKTSWYQFLLNRMAEQGGRDVSLHFDDPQGPPTEIRLHVPTAEAFATAHPEEPTASQQAVAENPLQDGSELHQSEQDNDSKTEQSERNRLIS